MTRLRMSQVVDASLALLGFNLAGWLGPDKLEWEAAIASGDTDTNAAPAGTALGARFGLTAIPNRWRNAVAQLRQNRTPSSTTPTSWLNWSNNASFLPHPGGRHREGLPLC